MSPLPNRTGQRPAVAVALQAHGEDMARALDRRLHNAVLAATDEVRRAAPKWESTLTHSVRAEREGEGAYRMEAGAAHAEAVELGRKPGKGLPRSHGVVRWLEDHAFARLTRRPKRGSAAFARRELALRDAYMALSRKVRAKGIAPQPFFGPVVERLRRELPQVLAEEGQASLARAAALASRAGGGGV